MPKRKCQRQDYHQVRIFQTEDEWKQWLSEEDKWTRFVCYYFSALISILDDLISQIRRPIPLAKFTAANISAAQATLVLL
jgi:hypothetical protein